MNRVNTATSLLVVMIFLAVAAPLWLAPYTLQMKEYGITLKFEGDKPVIDGKEICEDVEGDVIIKFGIEFQTIDVCELIEEKVIHVSFSEGVKYWIETLEELGIKSGMSAEEILATLRSRGYGSVTMPTVSITFWLISGDIHYISNDAFTSLDYYVSRGYDYFEAFNMMFENPLAIVEEHATIIIRSEELVESLVAVNMTRALEWIRRKLGIEETLNDSVITPETGECPPGTEPVGDGVCKRANIWGFPDTPPEWFYNRTIVSSNKNYIVGRLWEGFKKWFGTAYLFSKSSYPSERAARNKLIRIWSNDCFRSLYSYRGRVFYRWKNLGKPLNISYVLKYCTDPDLTPRDVDWNHTLTPGSFFDVLKPFVMRFYVDPAIGGLPSIWVILDYGAAEAGFKRTGFSIMGMTIYIDDGYNIDQLSRTVMMARDAWDQGARTVALIVPAQYEYLYDAFIFRWHIWSYSDAYWVAEPIPIITPYYKEVSTYPDDYWGMCFYSESGNYVYGCDDFPSYHQNINEIIEEVIGAFNTDYHTIESIKFNDIPRSLTILDKSTASGRRELVSLGSVVFSVTKTLVSTLFGLYPVPEPYGAFLSLVDFTDTTFNASAVSLRLDWIRHDTSSDNIYVDVFKVTKTANTLSSYYDQIGKKPLAAVYTFHFYVPGGGSPCPRQPDNPWCDLPLGESES